MSATAFRELLTRFYEVATRVLIENDAIVDKFVGDEAIGFFIPATAGQRHATSAIASTRSMLAATGHGSPGGPWLPIGAGVAAGIAFVGSIGEPPVTSMSALGDIVNVAARLASAAGAGEILVNERAAEMSGLHVDGLERRRLDLKGKTETTPVYVLGTGSAATSREAGLGFCTFACRWPAIVNGAAGSVRPARTNSQTPTADVAGAREERRRDVQDAELEQDAHQERSHDPPGTGDAFQPAIAAARDASGVWSLTADAIPTSIDALAVPEATDASHTEHHLRRKA